MSLRLLGKLVKAECPELQGRAAGDKAGKLQGAISAAKNSMVTWHAATPQVGAGNTTPPRLLPACLPAR